MPPLTYISEKAASDLVKSEVAAHLDLGHIKNPEGFAQHHIDTARIAYETAIAIWKRHPFLQSEIIPEEIRTAGYFHDLKKTIVGTPLHEIPTAYAVLTDPKLELVIGGTAAERLLALKRIASIIPPDATIYECIKGAFSPDKNMPHYPFNDERRMELDYLLRNLSTDGQILTLDEFALPLRLDQQITLYADLTNLEGKAVPLVKRLDEVVQRYEDRQSRYHDPVYAQLVEIARPRILVVDANIRRLLNSSSAQ